MLFSSIWRRLYLGCSRFVEIFHSAPFKMKRARRGGNMQMRIQIFADGTLGDKSFNPQNFSSCFQLGKKQEVRGWAYSFQSIQFSFRKSSRSSNLFANGLFMYVCAAVCAKYWKQIIWRNFHRHTSFYNHFADVALKFLIFHLSKPEYGSLVISGNTSRTLN